MAQRLQFNAFKFGSVTGTQIAAKFQVFCHFGGSQAPHPFDSLAVREQLRSTGSAEIVSVLQAGYPVQARAASYSFGANLRLMSQGSLDIGEARLEWQRI